jgi:predicted RNase H-like nuclease (RuvC/YqgF family)
MRENLGGESSANNLFNDAYTGTVGLRFKFGPTGTKHVRNLLPALQTSGLSDRVKKCTEADHKNEVSIQTLEQTNLKLLNELTDLKSEFNKQPDSVQTNFKTKLDKENKTMSDLNVKSLPAHINTITNTSASVIKAKANKTDKGNKLTKKGKWIWIKKWVQIP